MDDLRPVLEQIETEKGIPSGELLEMVEGALTSAFRKHDSDRGLNYRAKIDAESGKIRVFVDKEVVTTVSDDAREIEKTEALQIDPAVVVGDTVKVEIDADRFGRIAAQTARQIIVQKMRENERENIFQEFEKKQGKIVTGTVYRFANGACILEIGRAEAIMPEREQMRNEKLFRGQTLKVYIVEVLPGARGPRILVSRTHPGLVSGLLRLEVPEIAEGVVEIVKIVRDPGVRCKVAVRSTNSRVDPIGACVGINGVRVQSVINELSGERMDLIKYSDNVKEYLSNSLSPATVKEVVIVDELNKEARIVVAEDMLSLAIGKNGQNVRLAARITNWHIDIQSESQMKLLEKENFEKNYTDILNLPGVGEVTARLLTESGFDSISKLASSDPAALAVVEGIGEKTAEKIIAAAKEAVEGEE